MRLKKDLMTLDMKRILTRLRIRLDGVKSKNVNGARKIDEIIPRNNRWAVSMAIVDKRIALPNINMELPPDNRVYIPIIYSLLTFLFSSVAQAIQ